MSHHRNAKLGLAGRYALVCAVEGGMSLKAAAADFNVSPATAHRWWHRWLDASDDARAALSCLFDRSSRPHRSPRQLAPELAEAICACRRKTGWGPRRWHHHAQPPCVAAGPSLGLACNPIAPHPPEAQPLACGVG